MSEVTDQAKQYNQMAEWHWRANDKSKAIYAQRKAISQLQSRKNFPQTDLPAFESRF